MVTDDRQSASRRPSLRGDGSSNEREKCENSDLNARNSCWQNF